MEELQVFALSVPVIGSPYVEPADNIRDLCLLTARQDSRRQEPLLAGRPPPASFAFALALRHPGGHVGTSRPAGPCPRAQIGGPGDVAASEPLPFFETGPGEAAAPGQEQEPQPGLLGEERRPAVPGPARPQHQ